MTVAEVSDVDPERLGELCRRFGITTLDVFGSIARGEGNSASDIDLLYQLQPGRSRGREIEDLSDELAVLFGRPVDLVSRRSLHPLIREQVLRDTKSIYPGICPPGCQAAID